MKKNEKEMSPEHLNSEQIKDNQKKYESPSLIKLGKMQKITLGKPGSAIDGGSLGEDLLGP